MLTTVVNVKNKKAEDFDVYVGVGSIFRNPSNKPDPQERIEFFKNYFYHRMEEDSFFRKHVRSLAGKRLGVFEDDLRLSHAKVIADYLNRKGKKNENNENKRHVSTKKLHPYKVKTFHKTA